jgi:signal transduction histidine kinase
MSAPLPRGQDLVLVVDDDAGTRDTLSDILDLHGITAVTAASGSEALTRLDGLTPAVAIVDHGLPDMTGLELCAALKSSDDDLGVVVLTGRATLESAIAAVGQADEFLTKPVHPDELVRVVRNALLRRRLRQENADLIARLEASIEERTTDLAGLIRLGEAIADVEDVDEVLAAVVRTTAEATGAAAAAVYLADEVSSVFDLRASWPPGGAAAPLATRLAVLPDPPQGGPAAEVWLPLVAGGQRLGTLLLRRPDRVSSSFLRTLAVEAAVAIQNAQRFARERETVERLSEISRLKSAFLASVSHELRTPLTAVVGFAQTLGNYGDHLPPVDRKHMVDRIVAQGERLRRLIDNLLDSTALETGTLRVLPTPVDATAVINRVVDSLGDRASGVTVQIAADVPRLWADEGRLEQLLGNLLDNAVKYSAPAPVAVQAAARGDMVELEVADEGPGIDHEFLPRLFEAFTQADTSDSRREQGVGLGLFIARGVVVAMGGDITVESEPGKGATFRVALPRASRV